MKIPEFIRISGEFGTGWHRVISIIGQIFLFILLIVCIILLPLILLGAIFKKVDDSLPPAQSSMG